jgi:hypothetical protein
MSLAPLSSRHSGRPPSSPTPKVGPDKKTRKVTDLREISVTNNNKTKGKKTYEDIAEAISKCGTKIMK